MFGSKQRMVNSQEALPGHTAPIFEVPETHAVLGSAMSGPWPSGTEQIYLAMGCFWGAEEVYWAMPGVVSTSVGYMGGFTPNPTYEEVCTGLTGHTEAVQIAYRTAEISTLDILAAFWELHDPTQGYRQGGDIGTQYRSAIFWTTPQQRELAEATKSAYQAALTAAGFGPITTEIVCADGVPYYPAEGYHQQYLAKNPLGYRCHARTGIALPALDASAR